MAKRRISFDCETHLIRPGMLFPRVVCVTFASFDGPVGSPTSWIRDRIAGVQEVLKYLADPDIVLIGHNVAYDIGVICAEAISLARDPAFSIFVPTEQEILKRIFDAYANDRISDVMIRSMLVDIARGAFQEIEGQRRGRMYGLDKLAERWAGVSLMKADTWRLHYAYLDGTPIANWPQDAVDYAILDAEATAIIDSAIIAWVTNEGMASGEIPDTFPQIRAAWVLHLIAGWGVRVDPDAVIKLRDELLAKQKTYHKILDEAGIFKKDRLGNYKRTKKGAIQKDQKRLQELITEGYASRGQTPPMTTRGASTSAETARESGNKIAIAYADVAATDKILSSWIPTLFSGVDGTPITSSPNVLVASGRTSWSKPNWQNPHRGAGIRECVVSRPGTVLIAADLDTVELRALAQACLEIVGYSEMAEALRRGDDLHLAVAAEILGMDYASAKALYDAGDPIVTEARQTAKKANFSLPGGVGARKFAQMYYDDDQPLCTFPDGSYDQSGSEARAQEIKNAWLTRWREMREYLQHAGDICGDFGTNSIEQPWSGRIRGGLDYCSCANTYFQGRVADGTKLALWRLAYACYVDTTSPLYGSRIVLFLHDEVIVEVPEHLAQEAGDEIVKILTGAVQEVIPNIPITSAAVAMRHWYKGAKPVRVNGRLVPCKPQKDPKGKTTWVPDLLAA